MNFQLTKEQEFVKKMVRKFAEEQVQPIAADIDNPIPTLSFEAFAPR